MKKFFLFAVGVGAGTCLCGQQAVSAPTPSAAPAASASAAGTPRVLPSLPLLKPIADNMRWTLTTTTKHSEEALPGASASPGPATGQPGDKEKAKASVSMIVGERMGKLAHLVTVRTNGSKEEKWTDGSLLATMRAGSSAPTFSTENMERMPEPTWVTRENFFAVKEQGQQSYLVFQTRIMPTGLEVVQDMEAAAQGKALKTEDLKVDATAVINADTRLPVAVTEGQSTTTYKFEPLAPDTKIVPDAILASFAEREKKMQDALRKPVRP